MTGSAIRPIAALLFGVVWLVASRSHAQPVLQMPAGAAFVTLPNDAVLCGDPPRGFVVDESRRRVRPKLDVAPGYEVSAQIAPSQDTCVASTEVVLLVTAEHPTFDVESVNVLIDAGRIELRGQRLEGVRVGYAVDDRIGGDVCINVTREKNREACAVGIPADLPADPLRLQVVWAPASGRIAPEMQLFDKQGRPIAPDKARLPIARIVLSRIFPESRTVDLGSTAGRLELEHPEAVSDVECGNARCERLEGRTVVGALPASANTLNVRVRLLPRVFLRRGDALETSASESLRVLRCPLTVVSGPPLRNADDVQILVRLGSGCGGNLDQLRWKVSSDPVEVSRVEVLPDGVYVLLWVGRIARDRLTIVASRGESGAVLAIATASTTGIAAPSSGVSLPGHGEIDFIPRNREAVLTLSHVEAFGTLVPISVPGAYTIRAAEDAYYIRGAQVSSGFTSLRFAYRSTQVPEAFATTDFAHLVDPVQRPIREASVPAPIGGSSVTDKPVVELYCLNEDGLLTFIPSGSAEHIPFDRRNSCRLLLHRERIPESHGEQRLELNVSVTTVGGAERGEARLTQQFRVRHGQETDVIWIRGAKDQFDHIDIRLNHVIDESLFSHGVRGLITLPSSQWTVITEDADFRFYATAAIPASLYRFSGDPGNLGTGPLSLNFGVLSRLTWLDHNGREGLIGLEGGVMGMGLATDRERQLALVAGFGIAIPLGNQNQPTQAAINIHAWISYTVGTRTAALLDEMGAFQREVTLNPWAFVFGPSITVGSIGVFL